MARPELERTVQQSVLDRLIDLDPQVTADPPVTLAADGRLGVGDAFQFDGYAARSISPGEAVGGENTFGVTGAWTVPLWRVTAAFRQVDESFNPEVGFVNRDGYRFSTARIQRNFRFPGLAWFRELRPHVLYREFRDLGGFQESGFLHIDSHFEFANGAFFQLPALNFTREGLREPFQIPGTDVTVPPGTGSVTAISGLTGSLSGPKTWATCCQVHCHSSSARARLQAMTKRPLPPEAICGSQSDSSSMNSLRVVDSGSGSPCPAAKRRYQTMSVL